MPAADGPADVTEMKHPLGSSGLLPQLLQGRAGQKMDVVMIVCISGVGKAEEGL